MPEAGYDLPKIGQRTSQQKALGYLNAAREGFRNAVFYVAEDHPAHNHIHELITKIFDVEDELILG